MKNGGGNHTAQNGNHHAKNDINTTRINKEEDDKNDKDIQRLQKEKSSTNRGMYRTICGSILSLSVHSLLFVIFFAWAAVFCIRTFYDDYFVTIVQRAQRTDDDLLFEYTYYTRECSLIDLTADLTTAHQLVVDPYNSEIRSEEDNSQHKQGSKTKSHKSPADQAVDSVMLHGAVMIPSLLQDSTIEKLREFVVRKNEAVRGTAAQYPVSQGRNRISYGIEATEDDAVITALKEIHDHTMLKDVISTLVGPNPALSEITAITAHFGAGPQVWHSDTKADGNAVLHGRTYEHSYSLFIPLQDTTSKMGPTDLCPGTHYCADDDLEYLCEQYKIGLHQIRRPQQEHPKPGFASLKNSDDGTYQNFGRNYTEPNDDYDEEDGVWRRGDAVLLNQQVWHRGAAHDAEGSPDRIVFIVSFLGRPASDDPRQLARGTYFHMKWNMWGHTWDDMKDSAISMARPWSILRCLHIWKPRDRDWGYDLLTAAALRIGNQQLGCEPGDLERFVSEVMVPLGSPEFLDGTIDTELDEAWLTYLSETIRNYYVFLQTINIAGHIAAITLLVLVVAIAPSQNGNGLSVIWKGFRRTLLTHGMVVALTAFTLYSVHSSNWAKDIASGKTLMRPFLPEAWDLDDSTIPNGRTVFPQRFDVLVGSRFDSPHIGMYSHWLHYHYGNRLFDDFVYTYGGRSFRSLPMKIAPRVVQAGIDLVEQREGRFLQQDYRSGSWRLLDPLETKVYVKLQMIVGRGTLLNALLQEINFLYDHYRFGVPSRKRKSMAWQSQRNLDDVARKIFSVWLIKAPNPKYDLSSGAGRDDFHIRSSVFRPRSSFLPRLPGHRRRIAEKEIEGKAFRLFDEVEYRSPDFSHRVFIGTIVGVNPLGGYNVAFYSRSVRLLDPIEYGVSGKMLTKRSPVTEGGAVLGNFEEEGKLFPGKVLSVYPDGTIDIAYDDNEMELGVMPGMYWQTN